MSHRKAPDFVTLGEHPFNGQPRLSRLGESPITPHEHFYVRNHAAVPKLDRAELRVEIEGMVMRPLTLRVSDLAANFLEVEQSATLQCAGNRRDELLGVEALPGEVPWGASAIGTAVWRGVPLAAVLEAAGLLDGGFHVAFEGLDRVERHGDTFGFGGSIPLEKALDPGVLLAYEMNGEPLAPEHGYPLRVVVPGYIGARSVKWLGRVRVQTEPSDNHFQSRSYKLYPRHARPDALDAARGIELGELSVNAAITSPEDGAELATGTVAVRGYATAGGERTVERVEVSADHGRHWTEAELSPSGPGEWTLWRAELALPAGGHQLVCRAWDSAANTQPEELEHVWNPKGYMNNAWHRVRVWVD